MTKAFICYGFLLIILFLSGCYNPNYKDNYPPKEIRLKKIKTKKDLKPMFYYTYLDTLYVAPGEKFITIKDFALLKHEPTDGDWTNISKKALLLHENAHAMNGYEIKWRIVFGKEARWASEREGYEVQMRYLKLRGMQFTKKVKQKFVDAMMGEQYKNMASEKEIREFIDSVVGK